MIRIASIIFAFILMCAFLGLCAVRWLHTTELHQGGYTTSPDGKYLASIEGIFKEDFWGNQEKYYQFKIVTKKKHYPDGTNYEWELHPLSSLSILNPTDRDLLMYRGTSPFPSRWSPDSSKLEIDALGSTVTLYTIPKAEQDAAANP